VKFNKTLGVLFDVTAGRSNVHYYIHLLALQIFKSSILTVDVFGFQIPEGFWDIMKIFFGFLENKVTHLEI